MGQLSTEEKVQETVSDDADEEAVRKQLVPTSSNDDATKGPQEAASSAGSDEAGCRQFADFDDLMDYLCGPGRFTFMFIAIALICNTCPGAVTLGHALFLYTPDFTCNVNATLAAVGVAESTGCQAAVSEDQCSLLLANCTADGQRHACHSWTFDSDELSVTMVTRFQLVCDRAPLARLPATLYFVGFLIGSTAYGVLSDRIGRWKALMAANIHLGVFALAMAVAPTYWLLLLAEVFTGSGTAGVITVVCAFLVELTPRRLRPQMLFTISQGWCFGILTIAFAAWLLPDYRHQLAVAASIGFVVAAFVPLVGESPRWLLAAGRVKAAGRAAGRIAKWNRRRLPADSAAALLKGTGDASPTERRSGLADLLRRPGLRRVTLLTWSLFFAISMCYYGVSLGIGRLGSNVFLSCVFLALVEPPSRLLGGFLCAYCSRRLVLGVSFAFIGVSIIACSVMFHQPNLAAWRTACAIFGSFWSCMAFTTVWLYANEAFPTPLRAAGAGSGSTQARVGALLSTLVAMLDAYWPPAPFAVFGCVGISTLVVVYLLPETFGQKLPATLEEGDRFGRRVGSRGDPPADAAKLETA